MTFTLRPQWYEEPGTEDGKQSQEQVQGPVAGRIWFAQGKGRSVQLKIMSQESDHLQMRSGRQQRADHGEP